MNKTVKRKYAVLISHTEVVLETICRTLKDDVETLILIPGTLLQIHDECLNNKDIIVHIVDYCNKSTLLENAYRCPASNVKEVNGSVWPYLIAICDPEERMQLALDNKRIKEILQIRINDIVLVSAEIFGKDYCYDCIVRYIGLVPEMGPGYYFGLELLDLSHGWSPQTKEIPFVINYISCDPKLSFILPANWIQLIEEKKKKFSTRDLLCGTLERTQSLLKSLTTRHSSFKSATRYKKYENNFVFNKANNTLPDIIYSNGSDEDLDGKIAMEHKTYTKPFTNINSSVPSPNSKKDKATNTIFVQRQEPNQCDNVMTTKGTEKEKKERSIQSENLISLDNEDYARYVENYERNLERQHKVVKQTVPVGILKQKCKKKSLSSVNSVKPNTIMSLEDRDIVVIDKADIKESTMNESEVIVVDKSRVQKEVDLADLLGNNWPSTAGDAAFVLNSETGKSCALSGHISSSSNSSVSSFNVRNDRSKAGSTISHLVSSKILEKRSKEVLRTSTSEFSTCQDVVPKSGESKFKNTEKVEPIYDNTTNGITQLVSLLPSEEETIVPSPLSEIPGTNLGVGSMVEVSTDVCEDLYGVIRWIGCMQGSKNITVGVELEDELTDRPLTLTDGTNNGIRLFKCPNGRALFVQPNQCSKDRRFLDIDLPTNKSVKTLDTKIFGQMECPPVLGAIPPLKILNFEELEEICGKFKGIQGHHNSCYLDATLFAMFTFTSVFDSLLFRPPEPEDIAHYEEVQQVLREEIVNPLRKNLFVRADKIMKLRQLLDKLSSVSGLTSEEKDPEEFLNSLLAQIMRVDPFLKLSSGQDTFFYQLFVEKDERLNFPSVQQLFEQSFLASDIKLKEVPSCLIIQMPRFGKNFKMYPRILPSQVLDVTDIIDDSPRQCSVCGKLAEFECKECFGILQCGVGLESTAFCKKCLETVHSHSKRANHTSKEISVPQDFKIMAEHLTVPRLFMELFAVVCIETSHYVAFVKAGSGIDAPWCFFDSMADRKGEQNGYNIPEMVSVADLPQWLSEEGARAINEAASNDKMLPEHAKRLLCDAYMCMYQSTDIMMYR